MSFLETVQNPHVASFLHFAAEKLHLSDVLSETLSHAGIAGSSNRASGTPGGGSPPTPENATMMQAFEWYVAADGKHLQRLARDTKMLRDMGVSAMWIPPQCKGAAGGNDVGYGIYDLWDLGEFDQHGSTRTKYGDFNDLLALRNKANSMNMGLYFDAVLNHKAGGDACEKCQAEKVDPNDRLRDVGPVQEINAYVGFNFPGRKSKYSDMQWHWYHFGGTDWDDNTKEKNQIYRILGDGKYWAPDVDKENGNYDYLMFSDIDHHHPHVRAEMFKWGLWVSDLLNLHGMRFDAVKHYSESFLGDFLNNITSNHKGDFFCVGEFWKDDVGTMCDYLSRMPHQMSLFDTPLVYNFSEASTTPSYDLRKIFDGTLLACRPTDAVTLVMNHDTQPGQALQVPISGWFKSLAYAFILLRQNGYPCVFYGDLYGTLSCPNGPPPADPACGGQLGDLILARKLYAYGEQNDYWDFPTCVGWVRRGTWDRPDGCAVVLSNADAGYKRMWVGDGKTGEIWTDVLGWNKARVVIGEDGFGQFWCNSLAVSIYVSEGAKGREQFGKYKPKIEM